MIIVYTTCKDDREASVIVDILLSKRLIACAKKMPVSSVFWWNEKKDKADEILLLLETIEEKFDEIEKIINGHHSYETPLIFAIPVLKTTDKVNQWLREALT